MKSGLFVLAALFFLGFQGVNCASSTDIVRYAKSKVGSTLWSYKSSHVTGKNTNKCNIFVADVFKAKTAEGVPERRWLKYTPIGAMEWANPRSSYLTNDKCWARCSNYAPGDVIAEGGHVGIVTGFKECTSAARYKVLKNDWGFRSGQKPTCWRYQYTKSGC